MRRLLLASTCIFAIATPALAETQIATGVTAPVKTSTVANGQPDDVKVTSAGSVTLTSGTGITIDSNHKVVLDGAITIPNSNGATGIVANPGVTSGITVSSTGKITLDEPYAPTDIDNDGDIDGPFAIGSGRTGILTNGAFTGNITNSGTITIEGNDSAAIRLGGPLTGNFVHDGTSTVLGDRALGVGLKDVTGNVRLAGTITAQGLGAQAAVLDGNITGALVVQGNLTSTGYRYPTPPADISKLDADDLLQGGSALVIGGNVTGGIVLAKPPTTSTTDTDVDKDGIPDATEGTANVRSFGSAPAMLVGSATQAVNIGAVAGTGTGMGLIVEGAVLGSGLYSGVNATGIQLGGLGNAVTIAGGVSVTGSVNATAVAASATAIRIGAGTTTPELRNSGSVVAAGGGTATSISTAVLLEGGSNVALVRNSGTIRAVASATDGTARGIVDLSGNLDLIENSGAIVATGATAGSGRNIAIDLSANNGGATIKQTAVAANVAGPVITGDVRFGGGDDLFDIADGIVTGNTSFGAGANQLLLKGDAVYNGGSTFGAGNDTLSLAGTSVYSGSADFGGGSDVLTIAGTARFSGSLANSAGLAVGVTGGMFDVTKAATISSLSIGNDSTLGVTLDSAAGGSTALTVSGAATFGTGTKLFVRVASVDDIEGSYTVLTAGSIAGASNLTTTSTLVPFMLKAGLTSTATTLVVNVTRKSTTELGLNRSESSAYNAVLDALGGDDDVADVFLNITDGDAFRGALRQMLPDHAGGAFETVTMGSRAIARMLGDPTGPYKDEGNWGWWIDQVAFGRSKSLGDTASYDIGGWGISTGGEYRTGLGNLGLSIGYINGKDSDGETANEVVADQWEVAAHWRMKSGPLMAHVRGSYSFIGYDGTRRFTGAVGQEEVTRTANGSWNGKLWSASGQVSYDIGSGNFRIRPIVALDYYRLSEDGYTETGGGEALNLTVGDRTSDELAVTPSVAFGLDFGGRDEYEGWYRFELEAGRRQIVGGELGSTIARFKDGDPFTLTPEERTSGWVGKLRAVAGNSGFQLGGELNAEQQQGRMALSLRASLRVGL